MGILQTFREMFITLPLKTTSQVDYVNTLTQLITKSYSPTVANAQKDSTQYIQDCRAKMVAACGTPDGALDAFCTYLACTRIIKEKFPGFTLPVTWGDSLKKKNEKSFF